MYLFELFNDEDGGSVIQNLRNVAIDILTPFAANDVPSVPLKGLMKKLKTQRLGLEIDDDLVHQILDPNEVKIVKKIEDGKIYFSLPSENDEHDVDEENKQRDKEKVQNKAKGQALKNVKDKGPLG